MKPEVQFVLSQGWGDFKILWLMKFEVGKHFNGYLDKGQVVWQEVKEGLDEDINGEKLTPFMHLPYRFDVQGLVDALTENTQVIPTKQAEIDAEQKATKYHLEDMRKLVFKDRS